MEEMKCTYDPFAFSPRARMLRVTLRLFAHPLMWTVPGLTLASVVVTAPAAVRTENIVAAFLAIFLLILARALEHAALHWLDSLARRDAKHLRLTDPQRYHRLRRQTKSTIAFLRFA